MVQMVLQEPGIENRDFTKLRTVIYSAAPMPSTVLRRGMKVFGPIFVQMLGSSEGSSITYLPMAQHRPDGTPEEQARLLSTGFPFPTVAIKIIDEDGRECPSGEPGELLLRSPLMFRGYWNNSAATLDAVRDGWYHSGDVGRLDQDGYLYLVDRKKDMIISGGENIYSREVEEALLEHPAVAEVAVIGRPDEAWGESVCAIVVLAQGCSATPDELILHTRSLIAGYKKPKDVLFTKQLPKLVSGKIDKKALRSRYGLGS
jgi:acyl-CoA synthetase (AMP-forming)/AMP-acid ligase II